MHPDRSLVSIKVRSQEGPDILPASWGDLGGGGVSSLCHTHERLSLPYAYSALLEVWGLPLSLFNRINTGGGICFFPVSHYQYLSGSVVFFSSRPVLSAFVFGLSAVNLQMRHLRLWE